MFCPNCGKSDQKIETYCRNCGMFLPDFSKVKPREISPETHLKANLVLNVMTAVASLTLAILLYSFFLGKADTPVIIYITAGFLTAMFAWQAQVFVRNLKLRKHFKNRKGTASKSETEAPELNAQPTRDFLPEADFENYVPTSVVEKTTTKLKVDR
jgi:uncharacterized integral membrane protein